MKTVPSGKQLKILVTDKKAESEFKDYCLLTGDHFLSWDQMDDGSFISQLQKKA